MHGELQVSRSSTLVYSMLNRMFHTCEPHHTPKNIVPCIRIRYSVKKFPRLMPSRQATSPFNILCHGRDVQLYRCTVVHTLLEQQRILKGEVACLEGINLENFFTEYLILMHGTIFLGVWCGSQVWNILLSIE